MKKLLLLALFLINVASASPVSSYEELKLAMVDGKRFVIVLDISECLQLPGMPTGYFTPHAMMLLPESATSQEHVSTSDLHFTEHLETPSYEHIKYTFNQDNTVQIRVVSLHPKTFKPLSEAHTISCSLGQGVEVHVD